VADERKKPPTFLAPREVARRLTFGEALPRLLDLVRGEFRLAPPVLLRRLAAQLNAGN
jgi:hypothetical protein